MGTETVEDRFRAVGATLNDELRIDAVIAEGGFGLVYRATHLGLDRPVALKVLKTPKEYNDDARHAFIERFKQEARTVTRVSHPAVVQVLDFGVSAFPNGEEAAWTAMEWVEGRTLDDELRARRRQGGRHPVDAMALLRPIFEAVAVAHDAGIAHRDLKPANIMIVRGKRTTTARLLDFGIAKLMDPGEEAGSGFTRTASTMVSFSPRYAAPEQLSSARTGPWTDVHALAMILGEVLTDGAGYAGNDTTTVFAEALSPTRPSPAKHGIDVGAWEPVLLKALAMRPDDRYPNAGDFLAALDAAMPGATHPAVVELTPSLSGPQAPAAGPSVSVVRGQVGMTSASSSAVAAPIALGGTQVMTPPGAAPGGNTTLRGMSSETAPPSPASRRSGLAIVAGVAAFLVVGAVSVTMFRAAPPATAAQPPAAVLPPPTPEAAPPRPRARGRRPRPRPAAGRRPARARGGRRPACARGGRRRRRARAAGRFPRGAAASRAATARPEWPDTSPRKIRHRVSIRVSPFRSPRTSLLAAFATALVATPASAQVTNPALAATRRDLIGQALTARTANEHPRALDLAQRAGQIEMSVSLRRFIAEEQESVGRVAEAMNSAELCVREGANSRENAVHVDACRAISARIQPRVGRLTVTPPSPAPEGLVVRIGGEEVPAAVWGVPVIVTPGTVVVEAAAPRFLPVRREVSVAVGASASVSLTLEAAPPPPEAPAPPPAPTPAPVPAPTPPPPPQGTSAGPFVMMGAGALVLGGAATFLALSYSDPGEPCADDPTALCVTSSAATLGTLGWVSLGVGIGAAVGGVVWFVLDRNMRTAPRASLTVTPLQGGGTLGLAGTF
ncbi:MAG: serine/threonine-protein kinase [Polyangiales bacterium]